MRRLGTNQRGAPRQGPAGFTIVEASIVTVIVGTAVVAVLQLLAAGTMSNSAGNEQTTAVKLADNVREIAEGLAFQDPATPNQWSTRGTLPVAAYDDIKDLDGCTFQPPLDAARQPVAGMDTWAQAIKVETVAEDTLTSTRPNDPTAPVVKVTVRILHNGKEVYRTRWLVAAPTPPP